jgi:hypothetical protein
MLSVWTRVWVKLAWLSRSWSSWAARAVVYSVAPGQRGLDGERDVSPGRSRSRRLWSCWGGVGPEPHGIEGEDCVERGVEARQVVHGCLDECTGSYLDWSYVQALADRWTTDASKAHGHQSARSHRPAAPRLHVPTILSPTVMQHATDPAARLAANPAPPNSTAVPR